MIRLCRHHPKPEHPANRTRNPRNGERRQDRAGEKRERRKEKAEREAPNWVWVWRPTPDTLHCWLLLFLIYAVLPCGCHSPAGAEHEGIRIGRGGLFAFGGLCGLRSMCRCLLLRLRRCCCVMVTCKWSVSSRKVLKTREREQGLLSGKVTALPLKCCLHLHLHMYNSMPKIFHFFAYHLFSTARSQALFHFQASYWWGRLSKLFRNCSVDSSPVKGPEEDDLGSSWRISCEDKGLLRYCLKTFILTFI